jgi:hypothetical protein
MLKHQVPGFYCQNLQSAFLGISPIFLGISPIFLGISPIFLGISPIFLGISPAFLGISARVSRNAIKLPGFEPAALSNEQWKILDENPLTNGEQAVIGDCETAFTII